jgi:hypothetical protein
MSVEKLVCLGDKLFVKPLLIYSGFVPAQQQYCRPRRIECERDPQHLALRLGSQLLHVRVLGTVESVGVRSFQLRPKELEQFNFGNYLGLCGFIDARKPAIKMIGCGDIPHKK